VAEVAPTTVVVNYGPAHLRIFPDRADSGAPRYLIVASERPELPATWRPLGVVERTPPPGTLPRAGTFAWVRDHVVKGEIAGGQTVLLIYDRDGKKAERVPLRFPVPCTAAAPVLLVAEEDRLHGAVSCQGDQALVFTAGGGGALTRTVAAPGAGPVALYARHPDGDYLVAGRKVVRLLPDGRQIIGTVPPPGGGADARDLVISGADLLIVDGGAGRAIRMDRLALRWRAEGRLPTGRRVQRLRAAPGGDRLLVVWAEPAPTGTRLYGAALRLPDLRAPATYLDLGPGPPESDHELVPVAGTDVRALLVRTQIGSTGPLVSLQRLNF
jgi:hypothetical protein